MPELVDIASTIRSARLRRGASQDTAARDVGVNRSTWWRWEKGEAAPDDETRGKLADYLGVLPRALERDPDTSKLDPLTLLIRETVGREVERAVAKAVRELRLTA